MKDQLPDYNTLFRFNPLPNWVYDRATFEILDVNKSAIDHYGYTREEFLSMTIKELRPETDIPKVLAAHIDVDSKEGNIYFGVFTHRKKDGQLIRMEINGHKVDFKGRACIMVVCMDVTAQERRELTLRESEKKLKAASAIAKLGYWRLELDGKTLSWSDEVYDIWGLRRNVFDLNFDSFFETIYPADRDAFVASKDNAFAAEKVFDFSHRIVTPENEVRWVHHLGRKLKGDNGELLAYEGTVQDITVHKEDQYQLKLLESVITNTTDAVVITDAGSIKQSKNKIIYVNDAFTKMTGYTPQDAIGRSPSMLQGHNSDPKEITRMSEALSKGQPFESTLLNYKKSGEEYWSNISVSPITHERGIVSHFIAIERDVTEKKTKELENELLSRISLAFNTEKTLSTAAGKLCLILADFGGFDLVEIWLPNREKTAVRLFYSCRKTEAAELFYEKTAHIGSFSYGEGLPGIVWESGNATYLDDLKANPLCARQNAAKDAGITSMMGIPLIFSDEIVGIIAIGSIKALSHLSRFKDIFKKVETFIGSEINRKNLESDLRHVFDALPDIVCLTDFSGNVLRVNPAGCDLLGYTENEILFEPFDKFIHPDDLRQSLDQFDPTVVDSIYHFENRCITKNNEILWLSWTCNTGIEAGTIYAIAKNITNEKKLKKLNEEASDLAKIGSWELDLVATATDEMYWSPMTRRILEVPQDYNPTLTGGFEFYTEESKHRIQQAVARLIDEGLEFDEDLLLTTSTGKVRWVRCLGKGERINGKCVKIFGSFQDIHASKSLEIQIREILGSISDAFYALDRDWRFTYFNREAENLLNKSEKSVIGKSIWEEFPQVIGTPLEMIYKRVAFDGRPTSFEYFFPGDGKWYEVNAYPFNGGVSAYFKNIDDRKQTAEALRKASEEKTMILESIGDAFFTVNTSFVVSYWNKKAEELIYVSREEIVGKNLWEVLPLARNLPAFTLLHKALETGETVAFEEYFIDKYLDIKVYPSETGLSIFFQDISERKRSEQDLLAANERFEKVAEATNDSIWDWDIENNTFFRGKEIEKFFGAPVKLYKQESDFWRENLDPVQLQSLRQNIMDAVANPNQTRWEIEYKIIKSNGDVAHIADRGIIIRNSDGKATRMVGAMSDISERKKHEDKLTELNKKLENYAKELEITNEQLEQFAFIASHDLQEPLRMISSFLDLLKKKYGHLLDEKGHQYIFYAIDGAKRMKQIILDLLDYSRAGKNDNEFENLDLNLVLAEYTLLRRRIIKEKNAVIQSEDLPIIRGLKAPLTQTMHCLLDNAIKYSKVNEPPVIKINVENKKDDGWYVSVSDNGIGVDQKFFEKIFVIFQRLHNRSQYSGTGIGLAIAKKHVESWGGRIWIESKAGQGSTFYFSIPHVPSRTTEIIQ
nr:PAS domain S-box protein [Cytophagales bacterium]